MQIERDIPIPDGVGSERSGKYHFDEWEVGDSYFCETSAQADSAQTSAKAWSIRRGNEAKFTRRKVDNGYRLWRVK